MAANVEATLLNHYKIDSLYPAEWPAEKDQEDSSDEDEAAASTPAASGSVRRSKSRYSVLETRKQRVSLPGSQKTKDGADNLVQKDEGDPLGGSPSVVQILRARGLPVEDDLKLRNRFLLSSTTFSPSLFLSQVHSNASTEALLQGLDYLSHSIEQKSASLKVLVESNFERFVRAKATIDNVYKEMRDQGAEANGRPASSGRQPPARGSRPHSRQTSIGSHFRKTSGPFSPSFKSPFDPNQPSSDKKKNALVKEQEYGVQAIKTPLLEVAVKAEEVWGPALGGRDKEQHLKAVLASIEKQRHLFELGLLIQEAIKRRDYDSVVEDYRSAKKYADDAKAIADRSTMNGMALTDAEMHQIIVTARMWSDVTQQVDAFKRDVWRRLAGTHFTKQAAQEDDRPEEHMELIGVLLEIGVEDNPIWVWLLSRYDYLKNKVTTTAERSRVEIEILRRRLAAGEKPDPKLVAMHLRAASHSDGLGSGIGLDSPKVLEFWDHLQTSLKALLSLQGGILGEVLEFWETAQSFINGKAQRNLPSAQNGSSPQNHRLSVDGVRELENGAMNILALIREAVTSFFVDPPIEDISALFSPIPDSPATPKTPKTPKSAALSPFSDTRFGFNTSNIPPPSPRTGDAWERYAFWPPYSNSLSATQFLSVVLQLVGTAAVEMAAISNGNNSRLSEELRMFIMNVRDRCSQATTQAWAVDAESCKLMEDWTRLTAQPELTKMPSRFFSFEASILTGMQKLLFLSDVSTRRGVENVVPPPSGKLLAGVRSNFVASLYKALTGMFENVNKPSTLEEDNVDEGESLTVPAYVSNAAVSSVYAVDSTKKNVRALLTLSNLNYLRHEVVPHLISQFESSFSVKLTDEGKAINDVFNEIETRLFSSYVTPVENKLNSLIISGVASPNWCPAQGHRPNDARPYVYQVLLELVNVHTEVSTTTPPLTAPILKHLLETLTQSLNNAFKQRSSYSLEALMQATLDTEFMAQTLSNYTTERASELQSSVYVSLDERTPDKAAMASLQGELKDMRALLKRLRESTRGEFACFKRQRSGTTSGSNPNRAPSRP